MGRKSSAFTAFDLTDLFGDLRKGVEDGSFSRQNSGMARPPSSKQLDKLGAEIHRNYIISKIIAAINVSSPEKDHIDTHVAKSLYVHAFVRALRSEKSLAPNATGKSSSNNARAQAAGFKAGKNYLSKGIVFDIKTLTTKDWEIIRDRVINGIGTARRQTLH